MAEKNANTSHEMIAGDLDVLAAQFDLCDVHEVAYLSAGMMNRNWRLRCTAATVAVKQILDVPVRKARRSLGIAAALGAQGLPVCVPRATSSGEMLLQIEDRTYCVLPWIRGEHRRGVELTQAEALDLGQLLGQLHLALADESTGLESPAQAPRAKVVTPETAVGEADRFMDLISAIERPTPFDTTTISALHSRKELIGAYSAQRPDSDVPRGPVGWTHGDFQPLNLLWDAGSVTAVLDWDRLGVRPYAEEVVRTAQVQFGTEDSRLDLSRVAAFVRGYRSAVALADGDLLDAADRLWWKRMTDYWQPQWHYDKGDFGPDALWLSGEQLLQWWTPRRETVGAAFTGVAPAEHVND